GNANIVGQALRALDVELAALEPGGFVTVSARGLTWSHPLARAAVLRASSPAERRAAHLAMAGVLEAGRTEDAVWHLAEATDEPTVDLARRLEALGESALRRGALDAAALAFDRAGELAVSPAVEAGFAYRAAYAVWSGGESDDVVRRLAPRIETETDPL